MKGRIHSIETCGTVDGPGVRFVIFTQGCPLRCKYCHNPDTQTLEGGHEASVDEILLQYDGVKEFAKGGITVSGGEPLLQTGFVTELFKKCKKRGIHTCLDSSGAAFHFGYKGVQNPFLNSMDNTCGRFDELVKYTNLVLLDIKHIDSNEHKKLTGVGNKNILDFARYLSKKQVPVWIRHVLVPKITDTKENLEGLGRFLAELKNIEAFEILPYHDMARPKYEALGLKYPLEGILPAGEQEAKTARDIVLKAFYDARTNTTA